MTAPTEKATKSCFVIAPIGAGGSDTRKRSDKVLKHIFRTALEEKYTVTRADEIDEAGMITSQILRAVQDAHLVVADLTETNPNVLYELAVRHAIEKPTIHVIEPRLSKIPFDIAGFRTIEFDSTDLDSVEAAVEKLRKYAEQAEQGNFGETPIKLANIMRASKDDSPEMLLLKQVVEGISTISTRLENLEPWGMTGGFYGDRPLSNPTFGDIARLWGTRNRTSHQNLDPEALSKTMDALYQGKGFANAAEAKRAIKDFDESKQAARKPQEEQKPIKSADASPSQKAEAGKPRAERDSK